MNTTEALCPQCKKETVHRHMHDTAHDIAGTHMSGTERFECTVCNHAIFAYDEEAKQPSLKFVLDKR